MAFFLTSLPLSLSLQIALLVHKGGMTEVEVLRQLGAKLGTICGGVDFHNRVKNGEFGTDHNIVINVTLPVDDMFATDAQSFPADNDDAPAVSDIPTPPIVLHPVTDFLAVVTSMYESIRGSPCLTRQALIDLKRLKEDCLSREARGNLSAIEAGPQGHYAAGTPAAGFTKLPNSGGSLKRFRDWHEIHTSFGIRRSKGTRKKGYESDGSIDNSPMAADDLVDKVPVTIPPGKFKVIGRKQDRYCHGSQTDFDKEAMDASQTLVKPWIPTEVPHPHGADDGKENMLPAPQFPPVSKPDKGKGSKTPAKPRKPRAPRKNTPVKPEACSPLAPLASSSVTNAQFDHSHSAIPALTIPPEAILPSDVPIATVRAAAAWAIGTEFQAQYDIMIAGLLHPNRGKGTPPPA